MTKMQILKKIGEVDDQILCWADKKPKMDPLKLKKADGILELISLNCDKCEFNGNCDIKTAYHNAKDYAASMEFVDMKGDANGNNRNAKKD